MHADTPAELEALVRDYPPERVAGLTGIAAESFGLAGRVGFPAEAAPIAPAAACAWTSVPRAL